VEACGFRDAIAEIRSLGAEILGASVDSVKDQKAFADKFQIAYPLLCDTDKSLAKSYGVLGERGSAGRSTFLIDKSGVIRSVWPKVSPAGHPAEIITALKAL